MWWKMLQSGERMTARSSATADATRYVSQNLANCRNLLYNKSTTNRNNGVIEGYSWPTCSKQPRLVDCRIGVVNKLDRRRRQRRVLLTNRLSMVKFSKSGVWDKVPEGSTLIMEILKFPYNTLWGRWKEDSMLNTSSIRPVVSIQPRLLTDGQTDTRRVDDSKYRSSIASRGKNHPIFHRDTAKDSINWNRR